MATVYVDHLSQPARAVMMFIRLNNLPVQEHLIHIGRLQHKQEEYLAVYPLGKIPCLKEGEWLLPESSAILRYLATKYKSHIADHWFSEEPRARATVEAAMDWHHGNIRPGSAPVVWHHVLAPLRKQNGNDPIAKHAEGVLLQSLEALEGFWLKNTKFVAGNKISVADLLLCTELSGLRLLDGAVKGKDMDAWLQPFPRTVAWMAAVRDDTLPVYDDVHVIMNKAAERFKQRKAAATSKL